MPSSNEFPDDPHNKEEAELRRLHLHIWAKVFDAEPKEVVAVMQPYHPAYVAAQISMLETMVGCLAGLLVRADILTYEAVQDMIAKVYEHDIEKLHLTSTMVQVGEHVSKRKHKREAVRAKDMPEEMVEEVDKVIADTKERME